MPGWITLESLGAAENRTPSLPVVKEDGDQTTRELVGDVVQRQLAPAARRMLHRELRVEGSAVAPERCDQQVVDGEPHRAAPVGVAAEQACRRLRRLVVHSEGLPAQLHDVRVVPVIPRQSPYPVR